MPAAGDLVRASDVLERVGLRVRRVANQSVNTTSQTNISFDTEDEDTDGFITVTSATVTIPTGLGGIYAITFRVDGAFTDGGGTRHFCSIAPSSSISGMPAFFRSPMAATEDMGQVSAITPLLAGDSFTCNLYHSSGGAINFTAFLSCYRVSL